MRYLKYAALLGLLVFAVAGTAKAQVAVGVRVGPVGVAVGAPPVCAYGYYSYYPYACAPYGYYGPSWFANGVFIGAGPWYHRGYWGGAHYYGGPAYGRPGWGYRPGWGNRPAPVYHGGAVAHGYVGGGHYDGGHYGGGFHGGGRGR
jgi:hypothetical protein